MRDFLIFPDGAYPFLLEGDTAFKRACRLEAYMASGPGGQKRNRTFSAVRATHLQTGISAIAEESRSQQENRERALKRVRKMVALCIRKKFSDEFVIDPSAKDLFSENGFIKINTRNPRYPLFCAVVLDALYMVGGKVGEAAKLLSTSTGKLNRAVSSDKELFTSVNRMRNDFGLMALRRG